MFKTNSDFVFFWTMIVLFFIISNIYKTPSLPESKWCFQLPLNISTNLPPNVTLNWCGRKGDFLRKTHFIYSRHGTKISHLWKRKISFPATFKGDMLVPWRVFGMYLDFSCFIWISFCPIQTYVSKEKGFLDITNLFDTTRGQTGCWQMYAFLVGSACLGRFFSGCCWA